MRIYSKHEDIQINAQIDAKLRIISNIILETIPYVRSILVTGGFGKGEGSVEVTKDGKVKFFRDFDIAVIVDRIPRKETVQKVYNRIYLFMGSINPENTLFPFSNFLVGIRFLRKKDLIYPDIWFYDLKVASQLLYGEDVRDLIPWSKEDIPLTSGLRILFEKVCGLLGMFSYSYLKTGKSSKEKEEPLIFECYKTIIEICTALCILAGKYEAKYLDRATIFQKIYFEEFPELAKVLPDLPRIVTKRTTFKLRPDLTKVNENLVDMWFYARDYLGIVLRFYMIKYLGITELDWWNLPSHTRNLARHYYKPFLKSFMYARLGFSNKVLLDISSFLYQALTNLEYVYVITRHLGVLHLQPLRRIYASPSLKFFQAGIMILLSLNKDGTVDKELLQKAAKGLSHSIPVETQVNDAIEWDTLRKHFLKAYRLYRGYHFVK